MSDTSVFHTILKQAGAHASSAKSVLIVLDENSIEDLILIKNLYSHADIVTNRWDIHAACLELDLKSHFSDFEFPNDQGFDLSLYRISKERAVSHHILNSLFSLTQPDGHIILGGKKNEGIKSYYDKSRKTFLCDAALIKQKDTYCATLTLKQVCKALDPSNLDDKNYPEIRPIAIDDPFTEDKSVEIYSKPGLFGWNKSDRGSALLLRIIWEQQSEKLVNAQSILDLGCGYGYLSLHLLKKLQHEKTSKLTELHATDNNAAAIHCCQRNLSQYMSDELRVDVTADDCGKAIKEKFDIIVCNPPFHQGFETSRPLTDKFLNRCKSLLSVNGSAFFVVNVFVPIEKLANDIQLSCTTLENNRQFKVLQLQLKAKA